MEDNLTGIWCHILLKKKAIISKYGYWVLNSLVPPSEKKKKKSEYRIRERIVYFDSDPSVTLGKLTGKIVVNAENRWTSNSLLFRPENIKIEAQSKQSRVVLEKSSFWLTDF